MALLNGRGIVNGYQIWPGADLRDADLEDADLSESDLTRADLRGANLMSASFQFSKLTGANLEGANLEDAFLARADLTGANLEGAHLHAAYFYGVTADEKNLHILREEVQRFAAGIIDSFELSERRTPNPGHRHHRRGYGR